MENRLSIYKNMGETPLEALERARKEKKIPDDVPMTYAGRLDPMAEGLLIVLVGDECKKKEQYTNLSKTYEFEILEGASTDAYDILGMVAETDFEKDIEIADIEKYLSENLGTFNQDYPPYSSKAFEGKQLHEHARAGNRPKVTHEVSLKSFVFLGERIIANDELVKIIEDRIGLVHGDFRQKEIIEKWKAVLAKGGAAKPHRRITKWKIDVSSGFYIRQLVSDIGNLLGIPLTTFHIQRTRVGDFKTGL